MPTAPTLTAPSRGFDIAYDITGSGPPVVLLPGFLMTRVRWHETGCVEALADRFTVLTVDPLGYGESTRSHQATDYDAAGLATDTLAVLDNEGVHRAHIWGYSRGAALAADIASLHGERVRTAVFGGAPVLIPRSALPPNTDLASALNDGDWDRAWEAFGIDLPDETKAQMQARNDPKAAAASNAGLVQDVDRSAISCPVMTYVGGAEWFAQVVEDEAEPLGARFEIVEGQDHGGTFQAVDTVVPLVADFLLAH